jgi:hypothetical protein
MDLPLNRVPRRSRFAVSSLRSGSTIGWFAILSSLGLNERAATQEVRAMRREIARRYFLR